MTTGRETLDIEQVQPGTRLADPVIDDGGRVLIPAGAELTESLLAALRRRGITEVAVERTREVDQAAREAISRQIEKQLAHLFRQAGGGVETRTLYQAVRDFRMGQET